MDSENNTHKLEVGDIIEYNDGYFISGDEMYWQRGIVIAQFKDRKHCFKVRWLNDGDTSIEVSPLIVGGEYRVFSAPR